MFFLFFQERKGFLYWQCKPSLLHPYIMQPYHYWSCRLMSLFYAFDLPWQTWPCTHSKVTACVRVYSDLQTCLICIACRIPRTQPFNTESFITRQDPTGNSEIQVDIKICVLYTVCAHVHVVFHSREDHLHRNKCSASNGPAWLGGFGQEMHLCFLSAAGQRALPR